MTRLQSAAITIPTPQFHYLSKHAKTSMGLLEEKQQWEQLSLQRCLQETCAVSQPSREGFRILPRHQHSSVALAHTPNLITHTHDFQPATESSNQVAPEPAAQSSQTLRGKENEVLERATASSASVANETVRPGLGFTGKPLIKEACNFV